MRDFAAGVVALALLLVAGSLATTLRLYRRQRQRERDSERALGRTIIAELPTQDTLVLFSEDAARFYYGDRSIDKDLIAAARVLINGRPIAAVAARRHSQQQRQPTSVEDRPEGVAGTDGTSPSRRSPAPSLSNAGRFGSACRRSWPGPFSTQSRTTSTGETSGDHHSVSGTRAR